MLADLTAATATRWWRIDDAGRVRWRESPGGGVAAGALAGASVTLAGKRYRSNRLACLLATGCWPASGRVPQDAVAAVRGDRLIYRVPSCRKGIPAAQWRALGL